MKAVSFKKIIISLLVILVGYFAYYANYYKTLYRNTESRYPPSWCSDEDLKAINFFLNTEDNPLSKARAVIALKDNGCFYDYPDLVKSAQELVDRENEVVKVINDTDIISVDLLKEFEAKNPLSLSEPKNVEKDEVVSNLTGLIVSFNEELDKRSTKELDKLWREE